GGLLLSASRHLLIIERPNHFSDALTLHRIKFKYFAHHFCFGFYHLIICLGCFSLFDVVITVGSLRKHADEAGFGSMAFATPTALSNLRPLILGNHSLKLQ